jgi:hypothetical protein
VDSPPPSFFSRVALAFVMFFRVLFNAAFAARARDLCDAALPSSAAEKPELPEASRSTSKPIASSTVEEPSLDSVFQFLALLQREGRFIDFVQQDIASFGDADVGAAARVVHEGCRRALRAHAKIVNVREETEGSPVTVASGVDLGQVKLTGDVRGEPPYKGTLRHKGWRIETLSLPTHFGQQDPRILAPAEVELG